MDTIIFVSELKESVTASMGKKIKTKPSHSSFARKGLKMLNTKLKDLKNHFKKYEEQFDLLRWIDKAVVDDESSLENFFYEIHSRFKKTFKAKRIGIFSFSNSIWVPVKFDHEQNIEDTLFISKNFHEIPREVREGQVIITDHWQDGCITLFIPLIFFKDVLFIIILQDNLSVLEVTRLNKDIVSFAADIAERINVIMHYKENIRIGKVEDNLISAFFENQLNPNKCWEEIAKFTALFLPDWSPLRIEPIPLVQLLAYNEGDRYLILHSAQNVANSTYKSGIPILNSIPLKVEETICGLLIEQNKDVILINPQKEYSYRYQAYLFGHNIPQSELVIAIRYNGKIIALLNLEHQNENVFHDYHISLLRKLANVLAPFINALRIQEDIQRNKEIGLIYVMTDLLRRMTSTYRHKIGNLLLKSRLAINKLNEEYKDNEGNVNKYLSDLTQFIDDFQNKSASFLSDLPDYINYKGIDITQTINEAIEEFEPETLGTKEKIYFEFSPLGDKPKIFASQMLREHIYNLLNNSMDAIKDSIANQKIEKGVISILMRKEKVIDANEKETSPARIYVQINDNGGGVPEEDYSHIEEYGYTTKRKSGGTGFGLPAAKEYMKSFSGNLTTKNSFGKGFSVCFYLQEYDINYHKELINKIKGGHYE
jgi:signal transduction histidine kinase